MSSGRPSITLTLVILALILSGIYFNYLNISGDVTTIEIGNSKINTSSVGLAQIFFAFIIIYIIKKSEDRSGGSGGPIGILYNRRY